MMVIKVSLNQVCAQEPDEFSVASPNFPPLHFFNRLRWLRQKSTIQGHQSSMENKMYASSFSILLETSTLLPGYERRHHLIGSRVRKGKDGMDSRIRNKTVAWSARLL